MAPIKGVTRDVTAAKDAEDKLTEDLTADNNNLLTQVYVGWRITDPKVFFPKFAGGSVTEAEKVLEGMVRSAKSAVIGKHPLSDFVSAGGNAKFAQVEQQMLAALQAQLAANSYGIAVEFVGLPEARLNLAHAAVYLATAPKSNRVYLALDAAAEVVRSRPGTAVPLHLRGTGYQGAARLGHGVGYLYPHDHPGGWVHGGRGGAGGGLHE